MSVSTCQLLLLLFFRERTKVSKMSDVSKSIHEFVEQLVVLYIRSGLTRRKKNKATETNCKYIYYIIIIIITKFKATNIKYE